ncbi:MAG TPA: hypothetical protein VGB35_10785, partial [Gammaproteobacteria bacterium]
RGTAISAVLRQWPEVLEIIPHAGRLRIRLREGSDAAALMWRIRTLAAQEQLPLQALQPAAPELEDVFVALLEANRREGAAE